MWPFQIPLLSMWKWFLLCLMDIFFAKYPNKPHRWKSQIHFQTTLNNVNAHNLPVRAHVKLFPMLNWKYFTDISIVFFLFSVRSQVTFNIFLCWYAGLFTLQLIVLYQCHIQMYSFLYWMETFSHIYKKRILFPVFVKVNYSLMTYNQSRLHPSLNQEPGLGFDWLKRGRSHGRPGDGCFAGGKKLFKAFP